MCSLKMRVYLGELRHCLHQPCFDSNAFLGVAIRRPQKYRETNKHFSTHDQAAVKLSGEACPVHTKHLVPPFGLARDQLR